MGPFRRPRMAGKLASWGGKADGAAEGRDRMAVQTGDEVEKIR